MAAKNSLKAQVLNRTNKASNSAEDDDAPYLPEATSSYLSQKNYAVSSLADNQ